jgi:hypothetical protein
MRTTVDIDDPILKEVKALGKKRGQSLGRLISDLLAQSLRAQKPLPTKPSVWISKPMGAKVDLEDKEAVYGAMEQREPHGRRRRS